MRALATLLAILLAAPAAWAHKFPAVRTVVIQVERCEVVLFVGYRPTAGEPTEALLTRAATQPKSQGLDVLRAQLAKEALAPLALSLDGKLLVPTDVRTKIGTEPGGARPMIVMLVTYALAGGSSLALASKDPRSTRISWGDRESTRVDLEQAPAQGRWFDGVASFLLTLRPLGGSACATSQHSVSRSSR
jgi:hypothetical protein